MRLFLSLALVLGFLHMEGAFASEVMNGLMYKASVHDAEINLLKQNIENQNIALESVHQELQSLMQAVSHSSSDAQVTKLQKGLSSAVHDIKKLKDTVNELVEKINAIQKNKAYDALIERQGKQIDELEKAFRTLALAMEKEVTSSSGAVVYIVKPGDSLDRIAREKNSTVQAIKEANSLKGSTIHPGQELKIP